MDNRLGFLNKLNWFRFWQNRLPDHEENFKKWVDLNKLETVICLEKILNSCYPTLTGLIHNQTIRNECRRFEKLAEHHQGALCRVFPLSQSSEIAIEDKLYKYQLQLSPPNLFLSSVLDLAVNLSAHKIDIYRYLSLKDHEHRKLLNQFIEDSREEMIFLCRERNFHQNCWEDPLKVSLN
jgi:hypothetical protein